jgi:hypothetical protein
LEVTPQMADSQGIQEVVRRIRGEFLEMPGLRLTPEQAQRLWRLDETSCEAVLGALVDARFLTKTRDGAFVRDDGNSPADYEDRSVKIEG